MDSGYKRDSVGKDQRLARCAWLVGRGRFPNLAANDTSFCRAADCDRCNYILFARLERRAPGSRAQEIVDLVDRISSRSADAGSLDNLEQQSCGHRHGACRSRSDHAIFWREYFGHLLANPCVVATRCVSADAPYQSRHENRRNRSRKCKTRLRAEKVHCGSLRISQSAVDVACVADYRGRFLSRIGIVGRLCRLCFASCLEQRLQLPGPPHSISGGNAKQMR